MFLVFWIFVYLMLVFELIKNLNYYILSIVIIIDVMMVDDDEYDWYWYSILNYYDSLDI